jgi:hypothetical protein
LEKKPWILGSWKVYKPKEVKEYKMPITPYHLALNYASYLLFVKLKLIREKDYAPLWMMLASNLIDLDHLFRFFSGESILKEEYGINNLFFHGWWNFITLSILLMIKNKNIRWFAVGWLTHIFLDLIMIWSGLNAFLLRK